MLMLHLFLFSFSSKSENYFRTFMLQFDWCPDFVVKAAIAALL